MNKQMTKRRNNFIEALQAVCKSEAAKFPGLTSAHAETLAEKIFSGICFQYARTHLYIPANLWAALPQRNAEIYKKYGEQRETSRPYSSERVYELSQEYLLNETYLYDILKDQKEKKK